MNAPMIHTIASVGVAKVKRRWQTKGRRRDGSEFPMEVSAIHHEREQAFYRRYFA
jgi:hypothetical protein